MVEKTNGESEKTLSISENDPNFGYLAIADALVYGSEQLASAIREVAKSLAGDLQEEDDEERETYLDGTPK